MLAILAIVKSQAKLIGSKETVHNLAVLRDIALSTLLAPITDFVGKSCRQVLERAQ